MLQEGQSRKDIAKAIGVSTSTISRELAKNCDIRNGSYNYDLAQRKYETCLKLRGRKPVFTKEMKDTVVSLLEEGYSPEQIKGRAMWKYLPWSPMRRCIVGYGKINARKVRYSVPIPSSKREEIQQTWEFSCRKRIHPQSRGYRRTPCNSELE